LFKINGALTNKSIALTEHDVEWNPENAQKMLGTYRSAQSPKNGLAFALGQA
jgi:hypothetical protein